MVSKCSTCLQNQAYQKKEPLIFHEIPTEPWMKVGMDLCSFRSKSYLVIVDYYSNFIEVSLLNNQTKSMNVIDRVKSVFSHFGIPMIVVSDNGPQFVSSEFKSFGKAWDFQHQTSSPEYPKANGMAESAVKNVKRLFKKAYKMNEDPYLALLAHRSTPNINDTMSPAQKLFKREMHTQLPDLRSFISKKTEPAEKQLPAKFHQCIHDKQKHCHDQSAKELPQIPNGATVRIHEQKSWPTKAKIIEKAASPRSYNVQMENGTFLHRNRRDLLHTKRTVYTPTF